jgi:cysteine desulfurase
MAHTARLRDLAEERLAALSVRINRPMGARAPHILHLTLPDIRSETMLHELSQSGICVSAGSACSTRSRHISSALLAFGATEREADCSLRVSLCHTNTEAEVDALLAALSEGLGSLIRMR